mmetsp:Transcript_65740/g.140630  ORF Transcript_65740/g.140630 Transcript_65740/m.140630 type:complete len:140 (-) Transcript_65740:12-431(-)
MWPQLLLGVRHALVAPLCTLPHVPKGLASLPATARETGLGVVEEAIVAAREACLGIAGEAIDAAVAIAGFGSVQQRLPLLQPWLEREVTVPRMGSAGEIAHQIPPSASLKPPAFRIGQRINSLARAPQAAGVCSAVILS